MSSSEQNIRRNEITQRLNVKFVWVIFLWLINYLIKKLKIFTQTHTKRRSKNGLPGVATPIVSPSEISKQPILWSSFATYATFDGEIYPSTGQPTTQETYLLKVHMNIVNQSFKVVSKILPQICSFSSFVSAVVMSSWWNKHDLRVISSEEFKIDFFSVCDFSSSTSSTKNWVLEVEGEG